MVNQGDRIEIYSGAFLGHRRLPHSPGAEQEKVPRGTERLIPIGSRNQFTLTITLAFVVIGADPPEVAVTSTV